jgi:hypothetical protein
MGEQLGSTTRGAVNAKALTEGWHLQMNFYVTIPWLPYEGRDSYKNIAIS